MEGLATHLSAVVFELNHLQNEFPINPSELSKIAARFARTSSLVTQRYFNRISLQPSAMEAAQDVLGDPEAESIAKNAAIRYLVRASGELASTRFERSVLEERDPDVLAQSVQIGVKGGNSPQRKETSRPSLRTGLTEHYGRAQMPKSLRPTLGYFHIQTGQRGFSNLSVCALVASATTRI